MKIKALKKAYYNGCIVNVGEVVDYKGEDVPSWATLASGKETKKPDEPNKQLELKLTQELDELIKEADEINVWVNGTGKTLEEQISEYKEAIKAKKDELAAGQNGNTDTEIKADEDGGGATVSEQELDELTTAATELGIILEGAELDLSITEKAKVLTDKIAKAKA